MSTPILGGNTPAFFSRTGGFLATSSPEPLEARFVAGGREYSGTVEQLLDAGLVSAGELRGSAWRVKRFDGRTITREGDGHITVRLHARDDQAERDARIQAFVEREMPLHVFDGVGVEQRRAYGMHIAAGIRERGHQTTHDSFVLHWLNLADEAFEEAQRGELPITEVRAVLAIACARGAHHAAEAGHAA